jgi:hypothetical protein
MKYTVNPKYADVIVQSDVRSAARRLPPWELPVPKIEYLPSPPEPPNSEVTLERILAVLQSARQRESQPQGQTLDASC